MKKISLFILSLLVSVSVQAQEPTLPDTKLPDSASEQKGDELTDPLLGASEELDKMDKDKPAVAAAPPALEAIAAPPAQNKEILDKAIKEVFEEPKTEQKNIEKAAAESAAPAPDLIPPLPNVDQAPKIDQASAPAEAPNAAGEKSITIDIPEDIADQNTVAPNKIEAPKAVSAEAPRENAAVPASDQKAEVKEGSKIPEKALEPIKEESTIQEKVAEPIKEETTKPQKSEKPKSKKKKIKLPAQTPKSLRQGYSGQQYFDGNIPYVPASTPQKPNPYYGDLPANVRPIEGMPYTPAAVPNPAPNVRPIIPVQPRKTPASLKQGSIEENDLDMLASLPEKQNQLKIKGDINIDRGEFSNPFAAAPAAPKDAAKPGDPNALTEVNNDVTLASDEPGTPVVDFSNSEESVDDIKSAKNGGPENFYMQESGLQVEVKDAPKNVVGDMKNAYESLKVGQYESAVKYYDQVLASNPNNKKAMSGLATAYHMSKQYDNAKEEYLKIIKLDENYWPAVNNYIILVTQENPEKSIQKLEDLYHRNPTFATIPAQLGNLYFNKGNVQKAVDYYSAALKLEPGNIEYKYNLAVILEKAKQYADAATLYKSLLDDAAKGVELPESPVAIRDRYFEIVSKS